MSNAYTKTKPKKKKMDIKSYNDITIDIDKATHALNPLGNERDAGTPGPNPTSIFTKKKKKKSKVKKSPATIAYPSGQNRKAGLAT